MDQNKREQVERARKAYAMVREDERFKRTRTEQHMMHLQIAVDALRLALQP